MKFGGIMVGWEIPEHEESKGDSSPKIQWLGGSDLELGVFIFPIYIFHIQWGAKELRIEFPNHLIVISTSISNSQIYLGAVGG
jgi:hypothetical protein